MNDLEKHYNQVTEQEVVTFQTPPEPDSESTSNLIAGILRRWYIVLVVFFVMCAVGLPAIWLLIEPAYTVTGAIKVAPILADILTDARDLGDISNYESFMNTQAEMITSSRVLERVADDLVDRNLSFFETDATGLVSRLKRKLGGVETKPGPREILKRAIIGGAIIVGADRTTELIKITMESTKDEEAKQIVDAFISSYMAVEVSSSTTDEDQTLGILENERKVLLERIGSQQQALYASAQEYGTVALTSRQDMMLEVVASRMATLYEVEARRINLEAQVQLLEQTKEQTIPPEELVRMRQEYVSQDPAVVSYTDNITLLEQEIIVAGQALASTNPEIEQKTKVLEALKTQLEEMKERASEAFDELVAKETAEAGNRRLLSVRSELEQTKEYEKRLEETLSQEDTETIGLGHKQLAIQELQYNLDLTKESLDAVTRRIQNLEMQRKRPTRISVHYYADIASIQDRRAKLSVAMILGALACGMGLAHLRDKTDQSLRTPDDVAKRIGIRIIGTTTSLHTVKPSLFPEQIIGDYQTIRANLGLLSGDGIPKKLVVTSPGKGEGKTTFAINLATSMSESGEKVLLIDGDLRKPDVARLLNLPKTSRRLQDVLYGAEFDQAVYSIASTGLDVLAADFENATDAYELLALPSTAHRINMVSKKYDHVIIDTPPALAFPDALIWARIGDAVILASFAGQTTTPELIEAKERLTQINVRVLGTVLTSVQAGHSYCPHAHDYYAQSAQSRETARRARKRLLISVGDSADDADTSKTPEADQADEDYSYKQSVRSRKDTRRARRKLLRSMEGKVDNTDDSESPGGKSTV